ncbi:hypothetical protein NL676_022310 [Syzygium grande]|nr:hypothetical protein NL676_022310 [Syzygium grande]
MNFDVAGASRQSPAATWTAEDPGGGGPQPIWNSTLPNAKGLTEVRLAVAGDSVEGVATWCAWVSSAEPREVHGGRSAHKRRNRGRF